MKAVQFRKQIFSSILIFTIGGGIQAVLMCLDCFDDLPALLKLWIFCGSMWVVFWKGSEFSVDLLDRWKTWVEAPFKRLIASLLLVVGYVYVSFVVLYVLYSIWAWGYTVGESWSRISASEIISVIVISVAINMFMHGRAFLYSWRLEAINNERLKTEQAASQYNSLRNQVNPHFLFNSLNALSSLVYEDQEKAVKFIRKLSDVYRYLLDQNSNELVPLEEELDFLQAYIYLQKIRFDENLNININLEKTGTTMMPPLSLQLLVENAIKHNVISVDHPLYIEIGEDPNFITVRNNLQVKKLNNSTGIGLKNLSNRYHFLSAKEMSIVQDENHFIVKIPKLKVKSE